MKSMGTRIALVLSFALIAQVPALAAVELFEWAFNVDGTVTPNPLALPGLNLAGFNSTTGLGTITFSTNKTGVNNIAAFFNHDLNSADNTFFNEFGQVTNLGSKDARVSWEIDEPEYSQPPDYRGDIYTNFSGNALGNNILNNGVDSIPGGGPEAISMALAWAFTLDAGEDAVVTWTLSANAPASGFYLRQFENESSDDVFLSSSIVIDGDPNVPEIPEPSQGLLLLAAFSGLAYRLRNGRHSGHKGVTL